MSKQLANYEVSGEIDVSRLELRADVPLRVAAVRDGEILAAERLDVSKPGRIGYRLRFPLPSPCGFHLVVGRLDVPDHVFVAAPLARQWVSPRAMTQEQPKEGAQ